MENDDNNNGQNQAENKPEFNPDGFKNEMKDFVVRAVNGAVSTHLTRALDNKLQENNNGLLEQFKEMFSARQEPTAKETEPGDKDAAIQNAVAPIMKQLEEERKARERIEATARQERDNRMRQEETSMLQNALTNAGVAGPLAVAAVNLLHESIERDNDGNIVYVSKETGPTGPYDERIPVSEGVARFLATEDGKYFLPARPAGGSGNKGGSAPGSDPGKINDNQFVSEMLTQLLGG